MADVTTMSNEDLWVAWLAAPIFSGWEQACWAEITRRREAGTWTWGPQQ